MNRSPSAVASLPVCEGSRDATRPAPAWFSTRVQIVAGACVCGAATAFFFAVDPNHHAVYPQCLLYNTTGIYCAGCGATRALYALLHGRVLEALHDNALFIGTLPLMVYIAIAHLLRAWKGNAWPHVALDRHRLIWMGVGLFAVMAGFMILRNIPGPLFACLRPG